MSDDVDDGYPADAVDTAWTTIDLPPGMTREQLSRAMRLISEYEIESDGLEPAKLAIGLFLLYRRTA